MDCELFTCIGQRVGGRFPTCLYAPGLSDFFRVLVDCHKHFHYCAPTRTLCLLPDVTDRNDFSMCTVFATLLLKLPSSQTASSRTWAEAESS